MREQSGRHILVSLPKSLFTTITLETENPLIFLQGRQRPVTDVSSIEQSSFWNNLNKDFKQLPLTSLLKKVENAHARELF